MSNKLKALGLAFVAALAVGAVSVVSAGAQTGGIFHSESSWTVIKGAQEGTLHENVLLVTPLNKAITCKDTTYSAGVNGTTVPSIAVKVSYSQCETTDGIPVTVDMGNCYFLLTVGPNPATTHQTTHLTCTSGNMTVVVDPPIVGTCTIHIPPQTPTKHGVVYKHAFDNNKDSFTLDITVEGITDTKTESGFGCLGAGGEGNGSDLFGKVTLEARDTANQPVGVTATGSGG